MAYVFIDESGDLGFNFQKKGTSSYFVITLLFSSTKRSVEKVVKKTFRSLPAKVQQKHTGCLHAVNEKPKTRIKLLSLLNKQDISIVTIYLNKKKVYTRLQDEKHVLYNYVTNILLDRVYSKKLIPTKGQIQLIASQRETNKFLNANFKQYLENQAKNNHKLNITIEIRPSHSEKGLQAVDFACWAIYRKIERGDSSYINIINSRIIEESPLFP
ncbi:DUF3800 domain-containing protein [Candidatus Woesebacteria bacterium]|nr:MAG: DUF3800 domain-containing protein [Candidatus Woesebacteria bacterium]